MLGACISRRSLLGAVAVVAVVLCVVIQRTRTTELMHVGALTAAQDVSSLIQRQPPPCIFILPSFKTLSCFPASFRFFFYVFTCDMLL